MKADFLAPIILRTCLVTLLAAIVSSCCPSTEIRYSRQQGYITINPGHADYSVGLATPTLDQKKQGEIDAAASYALDSRGKKFGLSFKKTPFIEKFDGQSYFLTREVSLVLPDGRHKDMWPHGKWSVHIERVSSSGRETYEADFKLYTSIWSYVPGLGLVLLFLIPH